MRLLHFSQDSKFALYCSKVITYYSYNSLDYGYHFKGKVIVHYALILWYEKNYLRLRFSHTHSMTSSSSQRKPTLVEGWLVSHHEQHKEKQQCHSPWRPSSSVKRLSLCWQRYWERCSTWEAVNNQQQQQWNQGHQDLDLHKQVLEQGLVVYVPGEC